MFEVEVTEMDYLVHDGVGLRARIYRPIGDGPFPAFVELHGGAWIKGTYASNHDMNMPIAQGGVVVMAVDYRVPPAGTYPASVADANYAIRWLKMNAAQYGSRPDLVGVMGTSAGGHLAVLASMKPADPRYSYIPLDGGDAFDARVSQVVVLWPVICPATRYQENLDRHASGDVSLDHLEGSRSGQMKYWLNMENLEDASPAFAMERGDAVETPDILYVQALRDPLHKRPNMDRFCSLYRRAGGHVEVELLDEEDFDSLRRHPNLPSSRRAFRHIVDFANGKRTESYAEEGTTA